MTNTTENNEMKQRSQSSELTGSLVASESATHWQDHTTEFYEKELKRYNVGAQDYMYKWIREKSGK
jgi:ribosomal 30S subunit maturation factor RimM